MKRVRKRNNDFWGGLNMKPKMRIYALAVCLVLVLPMLAATYSFTSINPFSSLETSGRGINDKGDVVGNWTVDPLEPPDPGGCGDCQIQQQFEGAEQGYLWREGKFRKISFPGSFDTDANGINDRGVIVGTYADKTISGGHGNDHGFVRDEDGYHKLPDPSGTTPDFNGINNEGNMVGVMTTSNGNRGFLFSEGVYAPRT